MAFPTLFSDGKGDPTNPSLVRDISFQEKVNNLIQFAENRNAPWVYKLASKICLLGIKHDSKKRKIQVKHITIHELQQMATRNNSAPVMSHLLQYVANIPGNILAKSKRRTQSLCY